MEKLNSIIIESISGLVDIYLEKKKQRYYLMMIKY
jgi:hypothetical protein